MSRVALLSLALALVAAAPAWAQTADDEAAEIALWRAVTARGLASDYQGYLIMYPHGHFAPLARLRAGAAAPPATTPPATTPPATTPPASKPESGPAWVRPAAARVRLVDGVVLDTLATGLARGSNHRLAVMPATSPDAIADQDRFLEDSTPIGTARTHLTIPAGPPGADEVRLYYIPPYASAFVVGARAPVAVAAGVPGAVLARALVQEAWRLGPVRFEAAHRDRPLLVQAAFLRVRPRTEWNTRWFGNVPVDAVAEQVAVISIGLPGALPDGHGSVGEVVCLLPAADPAILDRIAAMQVGDPVLVRGVPTAWDDIGSGPLPLDRCSLRD